VVEYFLVGANRAKPKQGEGKLRFDEQKRDKSGTANRHNTARIDKGDRIKQEKNQLSR